MTSTSASTTSVSANQTEFATFAAGCFWCTEAVFAHIEGVKAVTCGYTGGHTKNPTYTDVCSGTTGHAEATRIEFDPRKVSYEKLLDTFWHMHDPTTLNRQGADAGTQYRSAIFYHSEAQRQAAEASKKKLAASGDFQDPIVTEIVAAPTFYPAEDYHQDYFDRNRNVPYCRLVIQPKLQKLGMEK